MYCIKRSPASVGGLFCWGAIGIFTRGNKVIIIYSPIGKANQFKLLEASSVELNALCLLLPINNYHTFSCPPIYLPNINKVMVRLFQGLLFLLLFNIVLSATAQTTITHLTTSDGLSQGMVTALIQDKEGFIWAGTLYGLNRYDGYQFKNFTHDPFDSNSICGNNIELVFEDSRGGIWVSVEDLGLDYYNKKTGKFTHLAHRFPILKNFGLRQIIEMKDGSLWLNYFTIGLVKIIPKPSSSSFNTEDLLVQPIQILSKHFPSNQNIFFHDEHQLGCYNKNGELWLFNTENNAVAKDDVTAVSKGVAFENVAFDKLDTSYWLIKDGKLLHWKRNAIVQQVSLPNDDHNKPINYNHLILDSKQHLWCWSYKGFVKIETKSIGNEKPVFNTIVSEGNAHAFLIDRQNRVWVGSNGYGLYSFNGAGSSLQSLPFSEGNYYIEGSGKKIVIRDINQLLELSNSNTTTAIMPIAGIKQVTHHLETTKGIQYYVGLSSSRAGESLELIQCSSTGKRLLPYAIPTGVRVNDFHIKIDQQDNCWFELPNKQMGCIYDGSSKVQVYDFASLMPLRDKGVLIKQIYQSKNGVFWLSTPYGLLQMQAKTTDKVDFKLFTNNPVNLASLSNNDILSVHDDPQQHELFLWVATKGGGLNKMNKATGSCEHFTTKDGLPNNVVYAVLPDSMGRLWLSTNQGISCFIPAKKFFHNFTVADGLQANEFNTGAFFQHTDGRLFFGGVSGINIIQPNKFLFDTSFAPVYFTNLKINNQPIAPFDSTGILGATLETTSSLTLSHHQNFINIGFIATNFHKLGVNHYRYKMDGVDRDWVLADTKNEANYPNLQPGTYTLHVSNSNENGDWNPTEATITFIIRPPWWLSAWAYMAYALLIAAAGIALYHFQIKRIRLQNELSFKEKETEQLQQLDEFKNRFFTNVTHELRTPLTLILEPARMLLSELELRQMNKMQIIYNNAVRLLRLVNTLLDISKLEAGKMNLHFAEGDIVPMLKAVFDSFLIVAQQKQLEMVFDAKPSIIIANADKPMLEKIAHNLLSNAIKFTQHGGTITLNVSMMNAAVWMLEIKDTGIGIPEKNLAAIFNRFYQVDNSSTRRGEGTGIGLALVKELVEQVNGKITVHSKLGEGTRFSIQFDTYPTMKQNQSEGAEKSVTNQQQPAVNILEPNESLWTTAEMAQPTNSISEITLSEQPADTEKTVLIVDDNAEMRSFIGMILQEQGYTIFEAKDGQDGIDQAIELMPSIIISDLMMPRKDGYELVAELKNNIITSHIPIVLLTAKHSLNSKMQGYQTGANAYLSKPFHAQELIIRMNQLLAYTQLLQTKYSTP